MIRGISMGMRCLTAAISMALCAQFCGAAETQVQSSPEEKESYSVGYSFGKLVKGQGVAYDLDQLLAGTRDAFAGKGSRLSDQEMKLILKELEKKIYVSVQKQYQDYAVRNLQEGEAFLRENSKKAGVTTLPSGLQYKIIKAGSGLSPTDNDEVVISYRGTLLDGTEFDNSTSRERPENVSMKSVIPGWAEALKMMKAGAAWQIFVPPSLGYGQRGLDKRIPPNSTLIFDIELISFEKADVAGEKE